MPAVIAKYDDPPYSKYLPSLTTLRVFGSQLGIYNHPSPEDQAYFFTYCSVSSGSSSLFIASILFPRFFRYHLIIPLILGHRRHRSHFPFISQRRSNRACGKSLPFLFWGLPTQSNCVYDTCPNNQTPPLLRGWWTEGFLAGQSQVTQSWPSIPTAPENLYRAVQMRVQGLSGACSSKNQPESSGSRSKDVIANERTGASSSKTQPESSGSRSKDNGPEFNPTEWIGAGKLFLDVPPYVYQMYRAARKIPPTLTRKLPNPDIPVSDFLAITLPRILSNDMAFPRRTSSWFSTDTPNCVPDTAWLNGAQSVVDPKDKNRRLPLWSIQFYREITDLHEAQEKRLQSKFWLPDTERFILACWMEFGAGRCFRWAAGLGQTH
ncbi:hypothetical protein B0H13DRAFT_1892792 [Mycena leptocephala]|nr:hypothetical protein B0H13DRAFT_1892792 [Mycena leptocephala]